MSSTEQTYLAQAVFTVAGPPQFDAKLTVRGGKIVSLGKQVADASKKIDLAALFGQEKVAILPGLVNAHTHLEFSDLTQPLGQSGMEFTAWIREVLSHRQQQSAKATDLVAQREQATRQGLAEATRTGTTTLGEIATTPTADAAYQESPLGGVLLLESLGSNSQRIADAIEVTQQHQQQWQNHPNWQAGVSPHAPYSTHRDLVRQLCQWSKQQTQPLAMHLAESAAELELLATHQGPMRTLLEDLGVWNPVGLLRSIDEALELLSMAQLGLVVHGNLLSTAQIEYVGQRQRLSIAYCPRTHAFFAHPPYPLRAMLDAGVNLALGTDSRASNPDLSLLKELRHAGLTHRDVSPLRLLQAATQGGAQALGLSQQTGQLVEGLSADFCVVSLPNGADIASAEFLLDDDCQVLATYRGGKQVTAAAN